ncbi:MAG: 1,4-dihydroxy-6-naphthoate synthase [Bacteroidia bacterium]|nr:1,4-dihydroxy-6-naphthoate synthase [Bacteroidia bacterium]
MESSRPLSLHFSSCPNDTFIFDALVHNRLREHRYQFDVQLADIMHLNEQAQHHQPDIIKVSYATLPYLKDTYTLLDAGSALGHNCGPMLISKRVIRQADLLDPTLRVGVPGFKTTANLLLSYFAPQLQNRQEIIFHDIIPALQDERIDVGVIIHENRFTYAQQGMRLIQDLGRYWEEQTNKPIPLGAIVGRTDLGDDVLREISNLIHDSIRFAFLDPSVSAPYVQLHAQEMDPEVSAAHIGLYVNTYSLSLGAEGVAAINTLIKTGEQMGLYPAGAANMITDRHAQLFFQKI